MKSFILATLLVVAVSASLLEEHEAKFYAFRSKLNKTYKNEVEEASRFAIFRDNLKSIEEHNALYEQGLVSFKKGINKFTDMTQEELRAYLGTHSKPTLKTTPYVKTGVTVPEYVDWRSEGQVTEVKDQGGCGSCWAFSVTGSTEAAYYRKTGELVSLSEQQLVDCSTMNHGCQGGYLGETFPYINQNGLQSESSYPYTGKDEHCKYNASQVVTKVDSYVSFSGESELLEAVGNIGPVSVAMDATNLFSYSEGIYDDYWCSADSLNHAVLVVGYGSGNVNDYWIVKNSWGSDFGEDGYFKLLRGIDQCGVSQVAVYPIIN